MDSEKQVLENPADDLMGDTPPATPPSGIAGPAPTKELPTTRAKLEKQLGFLRAFAAASGVDKKIVQNGTVAEISGVSPSTISSCNGFFQDIGLLAKSGRGYVPADAVLEFWRAWEWDKDAAPLKLAPLIEKAWFWEVLKQRLSFRELPDKVAIEVLGGASSAGPEYSAQLSMILDLLAAAGLISRENGIVRTKRVGGTTEHPKDPPPPAVVSAAPVNPVPVATVTTSGMTLNMSLSVSMDQVSQWGDVKKVQEFFTQWAALVNAKSAIEGMLSGKEQKPTTSPSNTGGAT